MSQGRVGCQLRLAVQRVAATGTRRQAWQRRQGLVGGTLNSAAGLSESLNASATACKAPWTSTDGCRAEAPAKRHAASSAAATTGLGDIAI